MTKIVDLGSGRGLIKQYHSKYANLHIDLIPQRIRRLYALGYLSLDEFYYWLYHFGYSDSQIRWYMALAQIPTEWIMERIRSCQPQEETA